MSWLWGGSTAASSQSIDVNKLTDALCEGVQTQERRTAIVKLQEGSSVRENHEVPTRYRLLQLTHPYR